MNELVSSGAVETVEGFVVYPLPGEEVVAVKPKKKRKGKVKAVKVKRGPGRPPVYNKRDRLIVAAALRKKGLTKGIDWLATERNLKVSLTLARSVAEEYGIEFKRGRPAA